MWESQPPEMIKVPKLEQFDGINNIEEYLYSYPTKIDLHPPPLEAMT